LRLGLRCGDSISGCRDPNGHRLDHFETKREGKIDDNKTASTVSAALAM
jgi:hypothetical protein